MENFSIPEYITLASLVTIAIFNYTQLKSGLNRVESSFKSDLARVETKIDKVESNLKSDVSELKSEFKSDLARVESKIEKVEENVRALEKAIYLPKNYEQPIRKVARNK